MIGIAAKELKFVLTLEDRFSAVARVMAQATDGLTQSSTKLADATEKANASGKKGGDSSKAQAAARAAEAAALEKAAIAAEKKRLADEKMAATSAKKTAEISKLLAAEKLAAAQEAEMGARAELSLARQASLRAKITAEQQKQLALGQQQVSQATQMAAASSSGGGIGGTGGVDLIRLYSFGSLATQIAGLYASLRGIVFPIQQAAEFERAMAMVKAIADASDDSFGKLSSSMLDLGYNSEFTAAEAAKAAQAFAAAGYQVGELVGSNFNAIETTLKLAQVGMMDTAAAAEILIRTLSSFGISVGNIERVADILTVAANETNVSIQELSTSLAYVAPVAGTLGMTLEEVIGPLAQLSNYGIKGSMAGTALRGTLSALTNPTKEEAKLMGELAQSIGQTSIKMWDARGRFAGLAPIMKQLEDAGLSVGQALEIFGDRAGTGFTALMKEGSDSVGAFITKLENTSDALEQASNIVGANTVGAWKQFIATINAAAISLGSSFLPATSALLKAMTEGIGVLGKFTEANKNVLSVVASLGAAIGTIVLSVKALSIIKGLGKWLVTDIAAMGQAFTATSTAAAAASTEIAAVGSASTVAAASTLTMKEVAIGLGAALLKMAGYSVILAGVATAIATISDGLKVFQQSLASGDSAATALGKTLQNTFNPENSSLFKWLESFDMGKEINLAFQRAAAEIDRLSRNGVLAIPVTAVADASVRWDADAAIANLQQQIQDKQDGITAQIKVGIDVPESEFEELTALKKKLAELQQQAVEAGMTEGTKLIASQQRQQEVQTFANNFSKEITAAAANAMREAVNIIKERTKEARNAWSEAYDDAANLSKQLNNLKNSYTEAANAAKSLAAVDSDNMKQALKNMWDNVFSGADISSAEKALTELQTATVQSEQRRVQEVATAEARIRDLRVSAVQSAVSDMNSLLEQASSRQLAIAQAQHNTEIQLIKNSGLEQEVVLNKTKAEETRYAKEVADINAKLVQQKKNGYEDALKAAKQNLDAIYAKEKSVAAEIAKLKKENTDSNQNAADMKRGIKQSTMSEADAYKDKLKQINEAIERGSDLMSSDYAEGMSVLKQAQNDARGLANEVKKGEQVIVSQAQAAKNASDMIDRAQDAINSGASARESILKGNLTALQDEAAATEKVADSYNQELQKLQNNDQLMININFDFAKADKMFQQLTQDKEALISVSVDTAKANAEEQRLRKELENIRAKVTAEVDTNSTQQIAAKMSELTRNGWTIKPVVDTSGYITSIKYMKDGYKEFATEAMKNPIKWDNALTEAQNLQNVFRNLGGLTALKVTADSTDAMSNIQEIEEKMESLSAEKHSLSLKTDDKDAKVRIKEIDAELKDLSTKKTTLEMSVKVNGKEVPKQVDAAVSAAQKTADDKVVLLEVGVSDQAPKMAIKEIEGLINEALPDEKEVRIRMASDDFQKQLKDAADTVKAFTDIEVDVSGTDQVEELLAAFTQLKNALKEELALGVKADPSKIEDMESALEAIKTKMASLSGKKLDVVDAKEAKDVEKLGDAVEDIKDDASKGTDLDIQTKKAEDRLKDVEDKLKALEAKKREVKLTVKLDASEAEKKLEELSKDRTTTLTVKVKKTGDTVDQYASGGPVFRKQPDFIPGDGSKDDVPALLMKGEYIIRKRAVKKYGIGFLNLLNSGKLDDLPRFAVGGLVGARKKLKYLMNPQAPISHDGVTYQINNPTFVNAVQNRVGAMSSGLGVSSAASLMKVFQAAIPRMATGGEASSAAIDSVASEANMLQQKYALQIRQAESKGDRELAQLYTTEATELRKLSIELERALRQIKEDLAETLQELAEALTEAKGERTDALSDASMDFNEALAQIAEDKAEIDDTFQEKLKELDEQLAQSESNYARVAAEVRGIRASGVAGARSIGLSEARYRAGYLEDYDQKKKALEIDRDNALKALEKDSDAATTSRRNAEIAANLAYKEAETANKEEIAKAQGTATRQERDAREDYQTSVNEVKLSTKTDARTIEEETADTIATLRMELQEALEELRRKAAESASKTASSYTGKSVSGQTFWLNSGGYIPKSAGVPGVDSVRAMLTPGEMVVRAPVVDALGVGFFDRLNKGQLTQDFPDLGSLELIFPGGSKHNVFADKSNAGALLQEVQKIRRRMA